MINPLITGQSPEKILREYWGYPAFRPLQREIIEHVLDGTDTLALLPTGGGKSICYQIPALVNEGVTIVVSPLVALMQDQVRQLKDRGISAEALFSGMHIKDIDRILDNCIYGNVKLLYLSPERLMANYAEVRIRKMQVSLFAIDEAHCISQWGHDFRPPYRELARLREWHPKTPVLALTASATQDVRDDIVQVLQMQNPAIIVDSFRRENLSYLVYPREDKWQRTVDILGKLPGSKLVYARSRNKTTQLAKMLGKQGLRCEPYHAGMSAKARSQVQSRWLEGVTPTVVCTTAFGMGIDKPDVRAVLHYDLPGSLEEYYQESGRAGRDGKRAFCVLLYDQSDIPQLRDRSIRAFPEATDLIRVYRALCGHFQIPLGAGAGEMFTLNFREFIEKYHLDAVKTYHCLQGLERDGWLELNEAAHHPSTVMILVNSDDLHDYQESNPENGEFLRTLLRNYEGLFIEPVRVREFDLAKLTGRKEKDVVETLVSIARDNVIAYAPADDLPRITFLRERVEDRNLTVDTALITLLKDRAASRADSVVSYLQRTECRESYLLSYFGEHADEVCGSCDICRSKRKDVSYENVLLRIPEGGIQLKELLGIYNATEQPEVQKILQVMESDELIVLDRDLVRLTNQEHK
jgi:ATP-dependent DNA helicase RecQ